MSFLSYLSNLAANIVSYKDFLLLCTPITASIILITDFVSSLLRGAHFRAKVFGTGGLMFGPGMTGDNKISEKSRVGNTCPDPIGEGPNGIESSGGDKSTRGPSVTPTTPSGRSSKNGLEELIFTYVTNLERVSPNGRVFSVDDNFFQGKFLPMFRVADEPPEDDVEGRRIYRYFQGKKRMFEFQFQGRLKQRPEGKLWLSVEIDHPVKIGVFQRAILKACCSFIRRTNKCFHYSFGDETEENARNGSYEKPHVAFGLEYALERLIISEPGDPLPVVGGKLHEPDAKRRRKGAPGSFPGWNTKVTYTMAIWSAYVDFVQWRILNLPGIRPFFMSKMFGTQPMNVVYYSLGSSSDADSDLRERPHLRKDLNIFSHYEIGNVRHTEGGNTQRYIDLQEVERAAAGSRKGFPMSPEVDAVSHRKQNLISIPFLCGWWL